MSKLYQIEFDELFDSKRQAVVCFLSLERKYLAICKHHRESPDCQILQPPNKVDSVCACKERTTAFMVNNIWYCRTCGKVAKQD